MKRVAILIVPVLALILGTIDSAPTYAGGATFTVDTTTNLSDSDTGDNLCMDTNGDCSLRAAIQQSNQSTGVDAIHFNIPDTEGNCAPGGFCVIQPNSPFPFVTDAAVIDGTTQPAFDPGTALPVVVLDGILLGGTVDGLRVTAGNSTIRGLGIVEFGTVAGSDGIEFSSLGGNVAEGNCIGIEPFTCIDCDQDLPGTGDEWGNQGNGIFINGTSDNTIGGTSPDDANFIGCNFESGIKICGGVVGCAGSTPSGNSIIGNRIGTDLPGTLDLGNTNEGVVIDNSPDNLVGGTDANQRNVIGGNNADGLEIRGAASTGNLVRGNYIGTNAAGNNDQPNSGAGVNISGAPNNTVGGTDAGAGNLVSGNLQGIQITAAGSTGNLIQGNFIGTNATGNAPLDPITRGNLGDGVSLINGAVGNTIGGTTVAARNVISGNNSDGVELSGSTVTGNLVQGNYIGTDVSGAIAVFNGSEVINSGNGVKITNAPANTIGGTTVGAGNLISGNEARGIEINGAQSNGNIIQGNLIGTDPNGTTDVPSGTDGIAVIGGKNTLIGGTAPGAGNVISGNGGEFLAAGVFIQGTTATGNVVAGNLLGTNVSGDGPVSNSGQGVFVNGAPNNTIGGTSVAARNVISGNGGEGVLINGPAATNVVVEGNYIGLDKDGATVLPNDGDGVRIASSSGNTIGGTSTVTRNVISGNGAVGVDILDPTSTNNVVQGNLIGTNAAGTLDRGNALEGVYINGGVNNIIGGAGVGSRNIISGNLHGVGLNDSGAQGNQIIGNFIGTNAFATGGIANTFDGVRISGSANNNVVGGAASSHNVIAYNGGDGVFLDQTAGTGNRIDENQIFLNGQLGIDIFPDGVTPNDSGDPDTGPNNVQNFPVLTSANSTLAGTTIAGTLNSLASSSFTLQIFSDSACDPSGNGEGQLFVGTVVVNTDPTGNASFNQLFPTVVANLHVVNATATDPGGNTSEFSACRSVAGIPQTPLRQGDVNCDSSVNSVDALLLLRYASGLSVNQNDPCPDVGTVVTQVIGDVDCSGIVNSVDALKVLRFAAALAITQNEPCTDLGVVYP